MNYLIIGGSGGIGKSLVEKLKADGHTVFATYNSTNPQVDNATFRQFDVLKDEFDGDFLPDELDGVAYCPGTLNLLPFNRIKPEAFEEDFKLQVSGAIKVLQGIHPKLKQSKAASVVLFSTVAVQTGYNFHTQVSTSKGAIEGLTRSLAAEWSPEIRVNAIAPSLTQTPLAAKLLNDQKKIEANAERHPLKRIGKPEDIAEMARFLLTPAASWITGQILKVDGGMSAIRK